MSVGRGESRVGSVSGTLSRIREGKEGRMWEEDVDLSSEGS